MPQFYFCREMSLFLCVWLELPSIVVSPSTADVSTHTSGVSTDDLAILQFQRLDSSKSQELQMQLTEMQDESQRCVISVCICLYMSVCMSTKCKGKGGPYCRRSIGRVLISLT